MKRELSSTEQSIIDKQHSGRYRCPECAHDRKKQNPTLVVTFNEDHVLYDCHHCGWTGRINLDDPWSGYSAGARQLDDYLATKHSEQKVTPIPTQLNQDQSVILNFFTQRGITINSLSDLGISLTTGEKFFPDLKTKTLAVGFVYGDRDHPEAIKWRPADGRKTFVQDGAAASFYGIERIGEDDKQVIIVEGEADVVALATIGVTAISVPNGAPLKVRPDRRIDPSEDRKFAYVWQAKDIFKNVERILVATDSDQPGEALAEELVRRTNRAKAWRVKFPADCKDPTDVIVKHGADVMREAIKKAEPFPLHGVFSAKSYAGEVAQLYEDGLASGESTGYVNVDKLFTVKEGMLYIVTGYPGSGKSEFIDQIAVNLALSKSWKWAVCSFENPPATHIVKLSEKIVRKPFMRGLTPRMTKADSDKALEFIQDHFMFMEERDGLATVKSITERISQCIQRSGCKAAIIDPYNYIDMNGENEHQSITRMLSELGSYARTNGIALFFVAHPAKIAPNQSGEMPVPRGHHISGSAAWFAKADIGITVHRGDIGVEIHCWKSRFKWLGATGDCLLGYDVVTGRYFESSEQVVEWGTNRSVENWSMGDWN